MTKEKFLTILGQVLTEEKDKTLIMLISGSGDVAYQDLINDILLAYRLKITTITEETNPCDAFTVLQRTFIHSPIPSDDFEKLEAIYKKILSIPKRELKGENLQQMQPKFEFYKKLKHSGLRVEFTAKAYDRELVPGL